MFVQWLLPFRSCILSFTPSTHWKTSAFVLITKQNNKKAKAFHDTAIRFKINYWDSEFTFYRFMCFLCCSLVHAYIIKNDIFRIGFAFFSWRQNSIFFHLVASRKRTAIESGANVYHRGLWNKFLWIFVLLIYLRNQNTLRNSSKAPFGIKQISMFS